LEQLTALATEIIGRFSTADLALLIINSLLLVFSKQILGLFSHADSEQLTTRLHIFRAINLLILLVVLFYNLFLPLAEHSWVTRALVSLLVLYLGYLGFHIIDYLIKKRFGKEREVNGNTIVGETYNSRVLSLIAAISLFIVVLISVVRILGFESLLEAGGVIGFVGVFLALTQGSWAPDIISGLIILNSRIIKEGDVVELVENGGTIGTVFKTKVFHTEVLNLANNHRIMLQNSRLRQMTIHNLSKFASARGLREEMRFNISYDESEGRVKELFDQAFAEAVQDADIPIEEQYPVEVRATDAGDYAVQWTIYYYTKDVKNLLRTRQLFLAIILKHAAEKGVSLATPMQVSGLTSIPSAPPP
jgi:small-conductance mechanosensitive channel